MKDTEHAELERRTPGDSGADVGDETRICLSHSGARGFDLFVHLSSNMAARLLRWILVLFGAFAWGRLAG